MVKLIFINLPTEHTERHGKLNKINYKLLTIF